FLIKVLAKGGSSKGSGFSDTSRSLEILDERFARGEITQKELEQMKKVIRT
ncbi:MAG: SHOCT domain-containing protein, partial [Deltaproteobacteria bacterium]|nr:SHOCT domain-containing protein [Deltaproteobacteria bacterium]